ncbi:MAG TPA: hypothetical protein VM221_05685 [Armatimonadota bacterium]|nr:hypothetical protein [Armatimonadota bacterium]
MPLTGPRALLLALLYAPGARRMPGEPIAGITRLQKLLFLLQEEYGLRKGGRGVLVFEPYRFGPYSAALYDEISFLENLNLITDRRDTGAASAEETEQEDKLVEGLMAEAETEGSIGAEISEEDVKGLEYLLDDVPGEDALEANPDERQFCLTPRGMASAKAVFDSLSSDERHALESAKSRFGGMSLRNLIRYVYTQYPESASESEIRDRIL